MDLQLFHLLNNTTGRSRLFDALVADWSLAAPLVIGILVMGAWIALPADPATVAPRRITVVAGASALIALGLAQVVGHIWFRDRPYVLHAAHLLVPPSPDPSFPSDHAVGGFALATPFLLDARTRAYGILLVMCATALAISRVLIGTHYPSDVLAGAAIGFGTAVGVTGVAGWLDRRYPRVWLPLQRASAMTDAFADFMRRRTSSASRG